MSRVRFPSLQSLVAKAIREWPRDRLTETLQFRFDDYRREMWVDSIPDVGPKIWLHLHYYNSPNDFDPKGVTISVNAFYVFYRDNTEYSRWSGLGRRALDIALGKMIEHFNLDPVQVMVVVHPAAGAHPKHDWAAIQSGLESYYGRLGFENLADSHGAMGVALGKLRANIQRMILAESNAGNEPPQKRQRS